MDSGDSIAGDETTNRTSAAPIHRSLFAFIIIAIILLAIGSLLAWHWLYSNHRDSLRIVLADLQNFTGNQDFDPVLKTALDMDLQQSPFLIFTPLDKIHRTLVDLKYPAEDRLAPEMARAVCQRLGSQAYLTASLTRPTTRFLITIQAFDCTSGDRLARSRGIADSPQGVVAVLGKVAADLRRQLGESDPSVQRFSKSMFARPTGSGTAAFEALKAYSQANQLTLSGKAKEAIPLFQQAIALDPKFALAYAELGTLFLSLGDQPKAIANLTTAYELRDTVDERNRLVLVAIYQDKVTGDIPASIRNYQSWSELYPNSEVPFGNLADLQTRIGKAALALQPARRALAIDPYNSTSYLILARAQMHLGQFEEAANTCRQAIARHVDTPEIHGVLLQVAYLRLDQPAMEEQFAWGRDNGQEAYLLEQQALMSFALGKVRVAQAILSDVVERYRKLGQPERANRLMAEVPCIEAELGLPDSARALLDRLAQGNPTVADTVSFPVAVPAAWAALGEASRAKKLLEQALAVRPSDTFWKNIYGPQVNAAIDLNKKDPEGAIAVLQPASAYDLTSFDLPMLRGRAYLAAHKPDLAETEFHKILDHNGIEPLSQNYALAQLGLARSLAQQNKNEEAGFAYGVVLQIWKDADPDMPRLKEAKAEYTKLTGSPAKTPSINRGKPSARPAGKQRK